MNRKQKRDIPAILGGAPLFESRMGIVRPALPREASLRSRFVEVLTNGKIANNSRYVRMFEQKLRNYLQIDHCLLVCNATSGLMIALKSMQLKGSVIVPSFTFSATIHALVWNGLEPIFADIDPDTFNLDPRSVEEVLSRKVSAVMAVHMFGNPCDIDSLSALADGNKIQLLFDSAHAFGSRYRDKLIGCFGDAEVFSFHATKICPIGEGGAVTTRKVTLARRLACARVFGDPGNSNVRFPGLNAKMSEFHAIVGLENMKSVRRHIQKRHKIVQTFKSNLSQLPGIKFQKITHCAESNFQNFVIIIDKNRFGMTRDQLQKVLYAENILTKRYFYPPLHRTIAYKSYYKKYDCKLPVTNEISRNILCLPLYSDMTIIEVKKICHAIVQAHLYAPEIKKKLKRKGNSKGGK
ncbi:DegT/DnrJ/EryC1/StrS family aminotransferase [Bacteroidota bacterium]